MDTIWKHFPRFLAWVVGVAVLLPVLGLLPTRRIGGEGAVAAMWAGCAISALASVIGVLPFFLVRERTLPAAMPAVLGAILVRVTAVVALVVAAATYGGFEPGSLVLWAVIAHAVLLVADIRFTQQALKVKAK